MESDGSIRASKSLNGGIVSSTWCLENVMIVGSQLG